MRRLLLLLLCLVFLGIGCYGGWKLIAGAREYRVGEEAYKELNQYIKIDSGPQRAEPTAPADAADATEATEPADPIDWPEVDFEALLEINADTVAWLYLADTVISYPIVQGRDNNQYVEQLFGGGWNAAGTNFMDYRNSKDLTDRNTVIYGHHMQNGTMLAPITKYKQQAFYDEHPRALLITPEGNYTVEFFAGYVTHMNADAWKLFFGSDEEFAQWMDRAIESSTFQSPVEPTPQDKVLTLSTCSYEFADARYVLLGVLKKAGE